jgi:hypothetical protein
MMHDRVDAIGADPGVGGFAVPELPGQVLYFRDDHSLRRHPQRSIAQQTLATCFRC